MPFGSHVISIQRRICHRQVRFCSDLRRTGGFLSAGDATSAPAYAPSRLFKMRRQPTRRRWALLLEMTWGSCAPMLRPHDRGFWKRSGCAATMRVRYPGRCGHNLLCVSSVSLDRRKQPRTRFGRSPVRTAGVGKGRGRTLSFGAGRRRQIAGNKSALEFLVAWHGISLGQLIHDGFERRWKPAHRTGGTLLIRETIPGNLPPFIVSLLPEEWLAHIASARWSATSSESAECPKN